MPGTKMTGRLLFLGIFLAIQTPVLLPQSLITGEVIGTITDPSGAVIPGIDVSLRNTGTGTTQASVANGQGFFRFPFVAPGSYLVEASAGGFITSQRVVQVQVGRTAKADIELSVAGPTTSIQVTESIGDVQTNNPNVSTPSTKQELGIMPNPGNDLTFYALPSPGVQLSTNGGEGNFSTYGMPGTSNTFTINGAINNDVFFNVSNAGASNLWLGSNAIGAVTIVNNGYSGQYGGLASSQVNYVSKSGTNTYHGNALYYWNGRAMNANNWFNNQFGEPKPFSNVNAWATSIGGPLPRQKDKTFFFFDYEGTHILFPTNVQTNIPSPQFASATLANLRATGQTQAVPFYQNIFNLYAGAPGAGAAQAVVGNNHGCGAFPLLGPNVPCALQFRSTAGNKNTEYIWTLRVDHNFSDRDQAFFQVQRDNGTQATYTDPINPIFNIPSQQPALNVQINENHTFGPSAVNQLILTGLYYGIRFAAPDQAAVLAVFPTTIQFSPVLFANMGGLTYNFPQGRNITQYQLIDDFSKTSGAHTFKFGVNFHRNDITYLNFGQLRTGLVTERNLMDFYNGGGTANSLRQNFPTIPSAPLAYYNLGLYAQDEWRVSPKLTLTLVLRADHNSNPVCQVNCFANLVVPFNSLPHDPNVPYNQVIQTNLHQAMPATTFLIWQPRFGFAWTSTQNGDTVVRGGFGLFGDTFPGAIAGTMASNTPLVNPFIITNGKITPSVAGSLFQTAAAANQSLIAGFNSGGTVDSISAINPFFQPPNFTTMDSPYQQARYAKWNLEVERTLPWQMVANVNYVGNHGYKLLLQNTGLNAFACFNPPTCFAGLPPVQPDRRFQIINQYQNAAVSNYNGLVLSLRKAVSAGLQFAGSYVYSHALDVVSNAGFSRYDVNTDPSILVPQNPYNIRQYNYGNADYDARQYVSVNYVWDDMFRHIFKKGGPNLLAGGWTVSGTLFYRTGQGFTVVDSAATTALRANAYGGTIFATPIQPGYNHCGAPAVNPDTPCPQITQFAPSTSAPIAFGNQTRNQYRGPGYFNTDLIVLKEFGIPRWESAKFGVGLQFFNLFNHPNFDKPQNDIAQGQGVFGTINNLVSAPTSIFGSMVGADASPRIIQLKAQLVF
jgi:hypothetical protein